MWKITSIPEKLLKFLSHFQLILCVRLGFLHMLQPKQYLTTDWKQKQIRDYHAAAAKSLQSCPTLCNPIDSSPPGSPVPGILQARILEWVAISFSNAWKWKWSRVQLLPILWTAAYQAPLSMGPSRKSTGVGCHCLPHVALFQNFHSFYFSAP